MPTTTISTTLLESVNIVLANLGESPVNTLTGGALPQQVSMALNTIEEVSTDIQSKGWWFNQQTASAYDTAANVVIYPSNTANEWSSSIPEEARRYITIRSSRIAQTRLIGSEELQKFSYNEELVSLAILQQAHVRNSGGVLDFNDFPAELRGLGMDEVMFLQGSVEDKLGTLRLGGELATIDKTKAETSLLADQEELVTKQALDVVADTALKTSQKTQLDVQTALQETAEKDFFDNGGVLIDGLPKTYRDFAAEMRIMGFQETDFQQTPAYKKVELIKDANKLRTNTATETGTDATEISEVNKVMRFIGEPPVTALNSNALASECVRLLRDTDKELQGRGWWFNTETDVELNKANISLTTTTTSPVTTTTTTPVTTTTVTPTTTTQTVSQPVALTSTDTEFTLSGSGTHSNDSADGTYTLNSSTNQWNGINGHSFAVFVSTGNARWVFRDADDSNPYIGSATVSTTTSSFTQKPWEADWTSAVGSNPQALANATFASTTFENVTTTTTTDVTTTTTEDVTTTTTEYVTASNTENVTATVLSSDMLSVEANDYDTIVKTEDNSRVLYDLKTKSITDFPSSVKAKVIYQRPFKDLPIKYLEYLSVRVAILLTELYPQSNIDVVRLPKMEAELRAYFKDREADDANYSVFDNYDAASRIGINRNYDLA